jgi:predicted nuclease of predicted toxin-antitoxin system
LTRRFSFIFSGPLKVIGRHYLQIDGLDFSDKALVTLCKEDDLVLLTHDKDFVVAALDILTLNPELY